jgi:uncharacterized membrane protein YqjE
MGFIDRARHLAKDLLLGAHARFRLLADELKHEERRFARALGWQLLALFLSCLSLALLLVLTIVIFWDTSHRIGVIVALTLGVALSAAATWWRHRHFMREAPDAFAQSVEELRRDAHAIAPAPAPSPAPTSVAQSALTAPTLRQEHLYLLLPVAVLAVLHPQATVRLGLNAIALWRGLDEELRRRSRQH